MRGIPQAEPPQAGADVPTGAWLFLPNFFTWEITHGQSGKSGGGIQPPLTVAATSQLLPSFFCQAFFHFGNHPRAVRGSPEGIPNPLWRLQQRRNRYPAFFAKLFFTLKKSVKGGDRCRRGGWSRRLRGFAFRNLQNRSHRRKSGSKSFAGH